MTEIRRLFDELGVPFEVVLRISEDPTGHYRIFEIKKRNGAVRQIAAPTPMLRVIQRKVLKHILYAIPANEAAKAYVPGKGIRENARFHKGQHFLLKTDITSFFSSIRKEIIYRGLLKRGMSEDTARFVANVSCLDGALPQGAPTSGHLSNLVLYTFDRKLTLFCISRGLRYTRYSDDISISGSNIEKARTVDFIRQELAKTGLVLNDAKTKLLKNNIHRQRITGIVVNSDLSPGRTYLRRLRQEMHYVIKLGVKAHAKRSGFESELCCISALLGKVSHARSICRNRADLDEWRSFLLGLNDYYRRNPRPPFSQRQYL